jgi:hypothetical protein
MSTAAISALGEHGAIAGHGGAWWPCSAQRGTAAARGTAARSARLTNSTSQAAKAGGVAARWSTIARSGAAGSVIALHGDARSSIAGLDVASDRQSLIAWPDDGRRDSHALLL